ncbi:MAG: hypothetical protein M5U08_06340 [Burkholderiales bacterium]|nr:hypothetical protein [Burkholderiales bacterium]
MGGGIRLGRLARFALREDILTWLALSGDPDLGGDRKRRSALARSGIDPVLPAHAAARKNA